ncbi:MAG: AAA family ATPase [Hyphomicrobiales bacterium]|nr:AAA family ATPase [Hyphomicrobiales bacterium]
MIRQAGEGPGRGFAVQYSGTSETGTATVEDEVFALLADPATYGLSDAVKRIDTHGAAVFLAGDDAYKVKRNVYFPFMDFSDREKREAAIRRELEVNRPNAPTIYLGVVPITRGSNGWLALGGTGEPVEWALHMRRFDEDATLDRITENERLSRELLFALAEAIAAAHAAAPVRDVDPWLDCLDEYISQNETAFLAAPHLFEAHRVHELTGAARTCLERVRPLLDARGRQHLVRLCHGDCHLGNIALIEGRPVLFDAIEFDDRVATGDVLYDLAFLLMDLYERDLGAEANLIFNRYLHLTRREGDLEALTTLPFFMMLRAAIRAKVTVARAANMAEADRSLIEAEAVRYFEVAEMFLEPLEPRLVAIGGLSGSGKSTLAAELAPSFGPAPGAVLLRSDLERKAYFGVADTDRLDDSAYDADVNAEIYHTLANKARAALAAGHGVIVDAVFARENERQAIAHVADAVEVPFHGLWLDAPEAALIDRVESRSGDASDANAAVVRRQLSYDRGYLDWTVIDAGGALHHTLAQVLNALTDDQQPEL